MVGAGRQPDHESMNLTAVRNCPATLHQVGARLDRSFRGRITTRPFRPGVRVGPCVSRSTMKNSEPVSSVITELATQDHLQVSISAKSGEWNHRVVPFMRTETRTITTDGQNGSSNDISA